MILCYLTNWLVVLFADKNGELHGILHLWQTWDGSLDDEEYVTKNCPKLVRYDYYKHYKPYRITIDNKTKRCATLISPFNTKKEKIIHYLNRVCWLYRNCGYGFAYYIFGVTLDSSQVYKVYTNNTGLNNTQSYLYIKNIDSLLNVDSDYRDKPLSMTYRILSFLFFPFKYKNERIINKYMKWNCYVGWKINVEDSDNHIFHREMLANRIYLRIYIVKFIKDMCIDLKNRYIHRANNRD